MPASNAERDAALRLQAGSVAAAPTSLAELIAPTTTDAVDKPKTTAELVEADQKALTSLRSELDKHAKDVARSATTAFAASASAAGKTGAVAKANAAYTENGPRERKAA